MSKQQKSAGDALLDAMTQDALLIAQCTATTQEWIKYNASKVEGVADGMHEPDNASQNEILAGEEDLKTTIEQLRASLEERDQLLQEKDRQISDLTRDYRHVKEVNIQLEKSLQLLDKENEGLKQDKLDLRDTILILKQPHIEKSAKLEQDNKLFAIKQPEYDVQKGQFDSIPQIHENDQDNQLLGADNGES